MAKQTTDVNFKKLLKEQAENYANAKSFNRWDPPPSDTPYTGTVAEVDRGINKDNEIWVAFDVELAGGEDPATGEDLSGKVTRFYHVLNEKRIGFFKDDAAVLAGEVVPDLEMALDVVMGAEGRVVSFKAEAGKTPGRVNKALLELLSDDDDVVDVDDDDPDDGTDLDDDPDDDVVEEEEEVVEEVEEEEEPKKPRRRSKK